MRALGRRRQRGQSLAEFTLILPIILAMAFSIAEFGVAYGTNMTLIEATREGARVGAVLANGSNSVGCPGATGALSVDPQVILAVERAIESPGSGITLTKIDWVDIFKSNATGGETTFVNRWTPALGGGPTICGVKLDFVQGAVNWPAASRSSTLPADSLGVLIQYHYTLFTPLSAVTGLFGTHDITMVDSTVMDIEPS
jgi:hypothetical protein